MRARGQVVLVLVAMTALLAACGDDDEKRYGDAKIVEKLNLEEVEVEGDTQYAIDGDLFCTVSRKLLNTRSEVEDAIEDDDVPIVVASREGNVGVAGVIIANDCRDAARKKLSKLDPEPAD